MLRKSNGGDRGAHRRLQGSKKKKNSSAIGGKRADKPPEGLIVRRSGGPRGGKSSLRRIGKNTVKTTGRTNCREMMRKDVKCEGKS